MPTSLAEGGKRRPSAFHCRLTYSSLHLFLGKSRADLWAFAALVAAEWGIERNNNACLGIVEPGDKAICQQIQVRTMIT